MGSGRQEETRQRGEEEVITEDERRIEEELFRFTMPCSIQNLMTNWKYRRCQSKPNQTCTRRNF